MSAQNLKAKSPREKVLRSDTLLTWARKAVQAHACLAFSASSHLVFLAWSPSQGKTQWDRLAGQVNALSSRHIVHGAWRTPNPSSGMTSVAWLPQKCFHCIVLVIRRGNA